MAEHSVRTLVEQSGRVEQECRAGIQSRSVKLKIKVVEQNGKAKWESRGGD